MADPQIDFDAIVKRRDEAVAKLAAIEGPRRSRANELLNKKNRQDLSADEMTELKELRVALEQINHAGWIIGQIAIQDMNNSALLADIRAKLEGVSDGLKKTKAKLKKIGETANAVAEGAEVVVSFLEQVKEGGKTALLT